jgi:hypothetical protein
MASKNPNVVLWYTRQILVRIKTTKSRTADAAEPAAQGDIQI